MIRTLKITSNKEYANPIQQSGKSWERDLPYFRITDFRLFNGPLSAYNTRIGLRLQEKIKERKRTKESQLKNKL